MRPAPVEAYLYSKRKDISDLYRPGNNLLLNFCEAESYIEKNSDVPGEL